MRFGVPTRIEKPRGFTMVNGMIFLVWMVLGLTLVTITYKLFGVKGMVAVIAGNVVIMNILVNKGVVLFGLGATAGNVLYGMIFLSTDILTEWHGGKEARKAVLCGFVAGLIAFFASMAALAMEPAPWDYGHEALAVLTSPMWRILLGSWAAYLISQVFDTHAYEWYKGKGLPIWVRNNGSTMVSQFLDTAIFCSIGLLGLMPFVDWVQVLISTYVLKVVVAGIDSPFMYLVKHMKK